MNEQATTRRLHAQLSTADPAMRVDLHVNLFVAAKRWNVELTRQAIGSH